MAQVVVSRQAQARKCIVYPRVSSDQQEDNYSLPAQIREGLVKARELGYEDDEVEVMQEVESGESMWDRPTITRIKRLIAERQCSAVVIADIDRMARDPGDGLSFDALCQRFGVQLTFTRVELATDPLLRAMQIFMAGAAAKQERSQFRKRSISGRRARTVESGLPATTRKYGYRWADTTPQGQKRKVGHFEPDPDAGEAVRLMYRLLLQGHSIGEIARELETRGYPNPGRVQRTRNQGGRWHEHTVRKILRDEAYSGRGWGWRFASEKVHGAEGERARYVVYERPREEWVELDFPPLVEREHWEEAQLILERNLEAHGRKVTHDDKWMLRGIAFCACGHPLYAQHVTVRGRRYWYYLCGRNKRKTEGTCDRPARYRADLLDSEVLAAVTERIGDREALEELLELAVEKDPLADEAAALAEKLAEQQKAADSYLALAGMTEVARLKRQAVEKAEAAAKVAEELEAKLAVAEAARQLWAEQHAVRSQLLAQADRVVRALRESEPPQQRPLLRAFGLEVTLVPEGRKFTWKLRWLFSLVPEAQTRVPWCSRQQTRAAIDLGGPS